MNSLNPILLSRFRIYARGTAIFVIVMSLIVLIGWATNTTCLMSLCPNFGPDGKSFPFMGRVHSAAAINLIIYASALLLLMLRANNKARLVGEVICAIGIIGATIAAFAMISGQEFESLRILQPDPSSVGITYPTPMALEIAIDLIVLGLSLLLFRVKKTYTASMSQLAVLAAVPIPLLIVLGAATQIKALCALGGCFTMSTSYSVLALLLCSAIFLSHPDEGVAAIFSGTTTSSMVLRRASLFLCTIPILLIVRTVLVVMPLGITSDVGWVIVVFLFMVLVIAFILTGVSKMDRVEGELTSMLGVTMDELERTRQSRSSMDVASGIDSSSVTQVRYKRVCLSCTNEFEDKFDHCPNDQEPLTRIVDDSLIGVTFAEKYNIIDMLGTGGMSTVYRARHLFLNKDVAVKVLKSSASSSREGLVRFQREARATSAVSHVGIVGILDFGLAPDGRAYLVMDYLKGESISSLIDRKGPLGLPHVIALTSQICEALSAAHNAGIVHRDLKPSNIMLVNNGDGTAEAKLVDFGLAKIIEEDSHLSLKLTKTGECFGSPLYMSPEQCMGKKIDHRTDIYALGAILYELLCGYPPIMGNNVADTLRRQCMDRPAPLPSDLNVPSEVKQIIYKCLQKDPNWRPQSAMEVCNVFTRISIWG
jgi:eukaryotic-like serine/threonine-protein kinase